MFRFCAGVFASVIVVAFVAATSSEDAAAASTPPPTDFVPPRVYWSQSVPTLYIGIQLTRCGPHITDAAAETLLAGTPATVSITADARLVVNCCFNHSCNVMEAGLRTPVVPSTLSCDWTGVTAYVDNNWQRRLDCSVAKAWPHVVDRLFANHSRWGGVTKHEWFKDAKQVRDGTEEGASGESVREDSVLAATAASFPLWEEAEELGIMVDSPAELQKQLATFEVLVVLPFYPWCASACSYVRRSVIKLAKELHYHRLRSGGEAPTSVDGSRGGGNDALDRINFVVADLRELASLRKIVEPLTPSLCSAVHCPLLALRRRGPQDRAVLSLSALSSTDGGRKPGASDRIHAVPLKAAEFPMPLSLATVVPWVFDSVDPVGAASDVPLVDCDDAAITGDWTAVAKRLTATEAAVPSGEAEEATKWASPFAVVITDPSHVSIWWTAIRIATSEAAADDASAIGLAKDTLHAALKGRVVVCKERNPQTPVVASFVVLDLASGKRCFQQPRAGGAAPARAASSAYESTQNTLARFISSLFLKMLPAVNSAAGRSQAIFETLLGRAGVDAIVVVPASDQDSSTAAATSIADALCSSVIPFLWARDAASSIPWVVVSQQGSPMHASRMGRLGLAQDVPRDKPLVFRSSQGASLMSRISHCAGGALGQALWTCMGPHHLPTVTPPWRATQECAVQQVARLSQLAAPSWLVLHDDDAITSRGGNDDSALTAGLPVVHVNTSCGILHTVYAAFPPSFANDNLRLMETITVPQHARVVLLFIPQSSTDVGTHRGRLLFDPYSRGAVLHQRSLLRQEVPQVAVDDAQARAVMLRDVNITRQHHQRTDTFVRRLSEELIGNTASWSIGGEHEAIEVVWRVRGADGASKPPASLRVAFNGSLSDGTRFAHVAEEAPLTVSMAKAQQSLIPCWSGVVPALRAGDDVLLSCRSSVAYSARGHRDIGIPPFERLWFEMRVLE